MTLALLFCHVGQEMISIFNSVLLAGHPFKPHASTIQMLNRYGARYWFHHRQMRRGVDSA